MCVRGLNVLGIRILAARFRTAANSGTLVSGSAQIRAARNFDGASIYALTSEWEAKFFKTSMACSTMEAYEYVCHIDRVGSIADSPSDKKQEAATALLCDTIQKRDFAVLITARASRILGPISRHLMAQVIPMICNSARASRP